MYIYIYIYIYISNIYSEFSYNLIIIYNIYYEYILFQISIKQVKKSLLIVGIIQFMLFSIYLGYYYIYINLINYIII